MRGGRKFNTLDYITGRLCRRGAQVGVCDKCSTCRKNVEQMAKAMGGIEALAMVVRLYQSDPNTEHENLVRLVKQLSQKL